MSTDCILVQNDCAHEIWRGKTKAQLPPFAPALVAQIIEVPADTVNEGDTWNGSVFSPAPPVVRTIVPYNEFRDRWTDTEMQALHAARLTSWQIDDYVGLAQAQNSVNLAGTTAANAKAALVATGVLTQDRANVIFSTGA